MPKKQKGKKEGSEYSSRIKKVVKNNSGLLGGAARGLMSRRERIRKAMGE